MGRRGRPGSSDGEGSSRSPTAARRRQPADPHRRGSRGPCRPGGCGRRSTARSGRAIPRGSGGSRCRLAAKADQDDLPRLAGRPPFRASGGQVQPKPGRGRPIEHEPWIHPLERVVRRNSNDTARFVPDRECQVIPIRGRIDWLPCRTDRPRPVARQRSTVDPERIDENHEPCAVSHEDLEPDLVKELPDAVENLGRGRPRYVPPLRPRRTWRRTEQRRASRRR